MPFTNAHHGGDREPLDLGARIDAELRARIEDAVDFACLDAMVKARAAEGQAAPVADNPRDRDEYTQRVHVFLEHVRAALVARLSTEQRARLGAVVDPPRPDDVSAALAAQVALAKELPDYWQRLEAIREEAASSGQRRGLLDRLLRR
jgi:hypothetical protein